MKKVFVVVSVFMLVVFFFTLSRSSESDRSPAATAVHSENVSETKIYSFSGSDEILTVMNGTVVLGEDEEIFYGGELKVNSSEILEGVSACITHFYVFTEGRKETVMINDVTDLTGGNVSFEGDLGKISSESTGISRKTGRTDEFINNLYFEITLSGKDGEKTSYELKMNVTEVK